MKPTYEQGGTRSGGRGPSGRADAWAWAHLVNAALGVWLVTSPTTFGYADDAIAWSDYAAGGLLILLGVASAWSRRPWWPWIAAAVGGWLLLAPLLLEPALAVAFTNSTLVGILAIGFAIVAPRDLGHPELAPDLPPGWSFNPSSWVQRVPIIALAWISFVAARHLTAYQLGYTERAWDPVFGEQTEAVLTSDISEAFPVSDAGLGAVAYALEALIGMMAGASRWRTAPWVVALFGVLVVPVGVVSIVLIMLQPLAVGAWCFLCLVTAATMLGMACLALPEVAGMVHYMIWSRRQGRSLWHTFWHGGPMVGQSEPEPVRFTDPAGRIIVGMLNGTSAPWSLIGCVAVGVWLMLAPTVLGIEQLAADAHYFFGAVVITFSVLAMAEVGRLLRWLNVLFGLGIAAAPWIVSGSGLAGAIAASVAGVLLIVLTVPRGPVRGRYGAAERWIR